MKSLICSIILIWNALLAVLGRSLGLFLGGLLIGFNSGIKDQGDMIKYMTYKKHLMEKKLKENKDERKDS
jgi:hypothetical protein